MRNPAAIYLFKVNNRNTRARCKICPKLTIKSPEQYQWCRSGVFIVNFEHTCTSVSIVNFEQVNAGWVRRFQSARSPTNLFEANVLYTYTNQSIGLQYKSIGWFLYE